MKSRWAVGVVLGVGAAGLVGPASAITIRDNQTYPAQDAALLFDSSAPLVGVADNLVQIGVGSGVYLGDGWVLSAAHFLPDTGGRQTVDFPSGVSIGADVFRYPEATFVSGDNGLEFDYEIGFDFALLQLDSVPTGLNDVKLYNGHQNDLNGRAVTFSGYGDTGNGSQGSEAAGSTDGQLHAGQNTVNQIGGTIGSGGTNFNDQLVFFDFDRPNRATPNSLGPAAALTYESMIAEGDSGGGVFLDVDGDAVLVGVNSLLFGTSGNPTASHGSIGGVSTLNGVLPWIAETTNNVVVQMGDANLNGSVEQADLDAVLTNWGATNRTWGTGDFTGDGVVDQADLDAVLTNWGASSGTASLALFDAVAVPEPGTLAILAAIGAGLTLRRRHAG